jgi:hypothetical protein
MFGIGKRTHRRYVQVMRNTSAKRTHARGIPTDRESPAPTVLTIVDPMKTATPPLERVSTTAQSAAEKYATPTAASPMSALESQRDTICRCPDKDVSV